MVPIIKKFNVLIRQITQQKLAKERDDPKAYLHNTISHQEKYVFKKIRTHYILNRMNKTKKKKKLPKGDECIKHLKFISVTIWSVKL